MGAPLVQASVRLELAASAAGVDSLANPRRALTVEVLQEEPDQLYLELTSHWPQLPDPTGESLEADFSSGIRPIDKKPSEYVDDTYACLDAALQGLDTIGD
jgi:hypothetical protein